jgi:flagellar biosynthesis/type III secretory pathway protein FliH
MNEETNPSISAEAPTMSRFEELKALVAAAEADFQKFYQEGNKAAGTRVRAAMQELKNLCQTIRTEVQTIKNEGKPGEPGEPS